MQRRQIILGLVDASSRFKLCCTEGIEHSAPSMMSISPPVGQGPRLLTVHQAGHVLQTRHVHIKDICAANLRASCGHVTNIQNHDRLRPKTSDWETLACGKPSSYIPIRFERADPNAISPPCARLDLVEVVDPHDERSRSICSQGEFRRTVTRREQHTIRQVLCIRVLLSNIL